MLWIQSIFLNQSLPLIPGYEAVNKMPKSMKKTTSSSAGAKRNRSISPDKKKKIKTVTPEKAKKYKRAKKNQDGNKAKEDQPKNKKSTNPVRKKKQVTAPLPQLFTLNLLDQTEIDEVLAKFRPDLDLKNLSVNVKLRHFFELYSPSEVMGSYILYRQTNKLNITDDTRKLQRTKGKLIEKMTETLHEIHNQNEQVPSDDGGQEEK